MKFFKFRKNCFYGILEAMSNTTTQINTRTTYGLSPKERLAVLERARIALKGKLKDREKEIVKMRRERDRKLSW